MCNPMIFCLSAPSSLGSAAIGGASDMTAEPYRIVGITYSAPARMPVGQRAVIVFRWV